MVKSDEVELSARRIGRGTLKWPTALGFALLRRDIEIASSLTGVLTGTGIERSGAGGLTLAGVDAPAGDVAFGCRGRHDVHRLVHCIEGASGRHAECGAGRGAAPYIGRSGRFRRASYLAGRCTARVDRIPDAPRYQQRQTGIQRPAMRV